MSHHNVKHLEQQLKKHYTNAIHHVWGSLRGNSWITLRHGAETNTRSTESSMGGKQVHVTNQMLEHFGCGCLIGPFYQPLSEVNNHCSDVGILPMLHPVDQSSFSTVFQDHWEGLISYNQAGNMVITERLYWLLNNPSHLTSTAKGFDWLTPVTDQRIGTGGKARSPENRGKNTNQICDHCNRVLG